MADAAEPLLISIIIPVFNAERWIDECLQSVMDQSVNKEMLEVSMYDDCSTDQSWKIMKEKALQMKERGIKTILSQNDKSKGRGCGWAKNRAIEKSTGTYLCFLDADDIMESKKIELQLNYIQRCDYPVLIGSNFTRTPSQSTKRFTEWHQSLTSEQLSWQQFKEVTLIHPTWFMNRGVWEMVGGYDERYPGCPEDMIFFYKWMEMDGNIAKIPQSLTQYRWHQDATSYSIHRNKLMKIKAAHLEVMVLSKVTGFTIWSVGRDGKKFFMSLSDASKDKVVAFCDVQKVGTFYMDHRNKRKIPIIHFSQAKPLVILCVALNRSLAGGEVGEFENNLASMNWTEGTDYYHLV